MNPIVFTNKRIGQEVRVIKNENNEPLFCLSDVCRALDITTPARVKESINREFEDGVSLTHPIQTLQIVDSLGRKQEATFITEPQLYFVLMRSDKPQAKIFRQWVISKVLPAIRKTGKFTFTKSKTSLIQEEQINQLNQNVKKTQKVLKEITKLKKQLSAKQQILSELTSSIYILQQSITIPDIPDLVKNNQPQDLSISKNPYQYEFDGECENLVATNEIITNNEMDSLDSINQEPKKEESKLSKLFKFTKDSQ